MSEMGWWVKGSKVALSPLQLPFTLLLASIFPHQYVCLWHPLSVLCVEATAVKRHFLGPHVLQPVAKSWRMTTRRWGLLWVEKLHFATLRPHEGRLSAKAVAPATSGRWFFNGWAFCGQDDTPDVLQGGMSGFKHDLSYTMTGDTNESRNFNPSQVCPSKRPPAKPPKPAYVPISSAFMALAMTLSEVCEGECDKECPRTATTIAITMAAFIGSDNGIALSAWE